jgi:hypothetical protein
VFQGLGNATFSAATTYFVGAGADCVTAGNFASDGTLDLAVGNFNSSTVTILRNKRDGSGTFIVEDPTPVGASPWYIAAGDFNADGMDDLATANFYGGVSVLLATGNDGFQSAVNYAAGANPTGIVAADLNGDGKLDLITSNYGSNDASLLVGKGDGTFTAAQAFAAGSGPNGVAVDDVNGDGKLDVLVANQNSNNVSILVNTSLQATAGQEFNGVLGSFTDANAFSSVSDFGGTVRWGDGTQSDSLAVAYSAQGFDVSASNYYDQPGSYVGSVAVQDIAGSSTNFAFTIGVQQPDYGTVNGVLFNDLDGDGQRELGEPGLSGQTVDLLDSNGQSVATTETASDGSYTFAGVLPGSYSLDVSRSGWTQTHGPGDALVVHPGFNSRADVGDFENMLITGTAFDDEDGDGVPQASDPGIAGATVQLYPMTAGEVSADPVETSPAVMV